MTVDVGAVHIETAPVPATVDVAALWIETAGLAGSATVDVAAVRIETKPPLSVATVDVAAVQIALADTSDFDWWVCSGGVLVPFTEKLVCVNGALVQ